MPPNTLRRFRSETARLADSGRQSQYPHWTLDVGRHYGYVRSTPPASAGRSTPPALATLLYHRRCRPAQHAAVQSQVIIALIMAIVNASDSFTTRCDLDAAARRRESTRPSADEVPASSARRQCLLGGR